MILKNRALISSVKHICLIAFAAFVIVGCDSPRVFEQKHDIAKEGWAINDTLVFDFDIQNPEKKYHLFYNVRYTSEYQYYNLYLRYTIADSSGNTISTVDLPQNMDLFAATTGEPHGKGFSDIYDYKILFLQNFKFPYQGRYSVYVKQFMRQDPLLGIKALGLRIEAANGQ